MKEVYQKFEIENNFKYVKNPNLFSHKKCSCNLDFQIKAIAKENTKICFILEKETALFKINNKDVEIKNKKFEIFLEKDEGVIIEYKASNDTLLFVMQL